MPYSVYFSNKVAERLTVVLCFYGELCIVVQLHHHVVYGGSVNVRNIIDILTDDELIDGKNFLLLCCGGIRCENFFFYDWCAGVW